MDETPPLDKEVRRARRLARWAAFLRVLSGLGAGLFLVVAFWTPEYQATAIALIEPATLPPGVAPLVSSVEFRFAAMLDATFTDPILLNQLRTRGHIEDRTLAEAILGEPAFVTPERLSRRTRFAYEPGNPPGIAITVTTADPSSAADVVSRVASALCERDEQIRRTTALASSRSIKNAARAAQRPAKEAADAVDRFRRENPLADPQAEQFIRAQLASADQRIRAVEAQTGDLDAEIATAERLERLLARRVQDEAATAKAPDPRARPRDPRVPDPRLAEAPSYKPWREAASKLEASRERQALLLGQLPKLRGERERLRTDLEGAGRVRAELARLESRRLALVRAEADAQTRAQNAQRALDVELGLDTSGARTERLVIAAPRTREGFSSANRLGVIILGLCLIIPAAIAIVLAREARDQTIHDEEEAVAVLGVRVLGSVPGLPWRK